MDRQIRRSVSGSGPSKYCSMTWLEDRLIRIGLCKKCYGGSELDRIDSAEDLLSAESLMGGDELGAFQQPRPEHRMCQVGPGLRKITDRVRLGRGTAPEPCDLREDEPHPVTGLAPLAQLRYRLPIRAATVLRLDETLEVHV
jgi:hypothetical protein